MALSWLVVACSSSSSGDRGRDAAIDAPAIDVPPDAGGPDADAGPCGLYFYQLSAVFLDWDSTAAAPCAITGSRWYVHLTQGYATTDASGMLAICLASNNPELDIQPPPTASTCTTPSSTYSIPGLAIATRSVADAGGAFVARSLDGARTGPFYAGFGSTFDATKGQLFVHVNGAPRAVAISSPHDAVQAFDGTAWASGDTGDDVFFPNIDLGAGPMTHVSVAGGALGTGSVPLVAGTITYMAVVVN
jgi:hypothetical protein